MYDYRKLTDEERKARVRERKGLSLPEHEPPHPTDESGWFLITGVCFEHESFFPTDDDRDFVLSKRFENLKNPCVPVAAWVVLPNHYHLLTRPEPLKAIGEPLRLTHGRTSFEANRRDGVKRRQVWYRYSDRKIRDERHYLTTLNYIHYNPVKHGYVNRALDWKQSSVHWYLEHRGAEWLRDVWQEYPVRDYGKGWDW